MRQAAISGPVHAFANMLRDCGVNADKVRVQIDNTREMMGFAQAVSSVFGIIPRTEDLTRPFRMYGLTFEVRTSLKVWSVPRVRELMTLEDDGRAISIPNA